VSPSRAGSSVRGGATGSPPPLGRKNHRGSLASPAVSGVSFEPVWGAVGPRPPASRSAKSSSILARLALLPFWLASPGVSGPATALGGGGVGCGGLDSSARVLRIDARISSRSLPAVLSKLLIPHLALGASGQRGALPPLPLCKSKTMAMAQRRILDARHRMPRHLAGLGPGRGGGGGGEASKVSRRPSEWVMFTSNHLRRTSR